MWTKYDSTGAPVTVSQPSEYPQSRTITGTTDAGPASMAAGNCICYWNSATGGTQSGPAASNSGNKLTIVDINNSAFANNITFAPTGGVVGNAKVYTNRGYQTWIDGTSWTNAQ